MKKKPAILKFKIRIELFFNFAKTKLGFIRRDKDEFIKYGVTQDKITALENMVQTFGDIPTDDELLGAQMTTTQEKDAIAETLKEVIDSIITRAANKYGEDSGYYRKFGVSNLSKLDGGELSSCARRVYRVGTIMFNELKSEGLSAEILFQLKQQETKYNEALGKQEDAMADRDIATENRTNKANEIYDLLVKYCNTGKKIWESKNEAKYNDYVIYDTSSGTAGEGAEGNTPGA